MSREEGEKLAKQLGLDYMECSALTQDGLVAIFDAIVDLFIQSYKKEKGQAAVKGATAGTPSAEIGCKCTIM